MADPQSKPDSFDPRSVFLRTIQAFITWSVRAGPKPEFDIPGGSQADADLALLSLASLVTGPRDGRAVRYLNNFLLGAPENPLTFSCAEMLAENPLIKQKVLKKIAEFQKLKIKESQGTKNIIVIEHKDYLKGSAKGREWWGAVGSFRFEWKILNTSTKDRTVVRVWGDDVYQWHPEDDRWTKAVHEAATRLQRSNGARPFRLIGVPGSMVVNTGEVLGVTDPGGGRMA